MFLLSCETVWKLVFIYFLFPFHTIPCFSSSADKLAMELGNEITFFIDPKIDNEFMVDAANDLQCVMDKKVNIIKHQVIKLISLNLDWNTMNYDSKIFDHIHLFYLDTT